jgi:hypothetical protein
MHATCLTKFAQTFIAVAFFLCGLALHADDSPRRGRSVRPIPTGKSAYTVPDSEMTWGETTNLQLKAPFNLEPAIFKSGIRASNGVISISRTRTTSPNVSVYFEDVYGRPIWTVPAVTNQEVPTHLMREDESFSFFFLPPKNERFTVELTDAHGGQVPKTKIGREITSPTLGGKHWKHWDKDGRQCLFALSHVDIELYPFDPKDYFFIEKAGVYNLRLVQHFYIIDTNDLLKAIDLPPITIKVKAEN